MLHRQVGRLLLIDNPRMGSGSGLELAFDDLSEQLRKQGWLLDRASALIGDSGLAARSRLARLQRWRWLIDRWQHLPGEWRRLASALARTRAYYHAASHHLAAIEALLRGRPPYDRVLLCVDHQPPGMTAMVLAHCPQAILISLNALAHELGDRWWPLLRRVVERRNTAHPYLYRRVAASQIGQVVFASAGWCNAALAAGLPGSAARVIPFGLPLPPPAPRPSPAGHRLLWVGRLSREKGLHLLLEALPLIRARLPTVRLTAIAGDGPPAYRKVIDAQIRRAGLGEIVRICPPVPRDQLQQVYAAHDLLFFVSAHTDPVALVLMEAFAAGLPVLSTQALPGATLVRDGATCRCFTPGRPADLANAAVGLLTDPSLAHRLSNEAQTLVRTSFTLEAMGAAYDHLLRTI